MTSPKRIRIYKIKITLIGVRPPIWRRVLVPSEMTLEDLHQIIQITMGWENSHLHEFEVGNKIYNGSDPDDGGSGFDDRKVSPEWDMKLKTIYGRGVREFSYVYDFGDNWQHKIQIEESTPPEPDMVYPHLVTGKRRCPPEDVGGTWGYASFLEVLKDSSLPDPSEYREWFDGEFDPEEFNLEAIERNLAKWSGLLPPED